MSISHTKARDLETKYVIHDGVAGIGFNVMASVTFFPNTFLYVPYREKCLHPKEQIVYP